MKKEFTKADFDHNQPMSETPFYKWMDKNKITEHHRIKTIRQYLESLGFIVGEHYMSKNSQGLRHILDHHFHNNLKG